MSKDKLDSIKLQILRNKNLSTTIDKKQYTLSDINDLANKIHKKVSAEMRLLIFTMILQKKVKKLQNKQIDKQIVGKIIWILLIL